MRNDITGLFKNPNDDPSKKDITDNLNKGQKWAMRNFHNDHSLIIKKVDKSSAITIKSRDDHIKDGLEHLREPTFST